LLLALLTALAQAGAPAPIAVTPDEAKALASREIVVRPAGSGNTTVALMDVHTTPEKLMAAVLDIPPRAKEVGAITRAEGYGHLPDKVHPTHLGGSFDLAILGTRTTFNIEYAVDWAAGYTTYHLDPSRKNDISSSNGSYQVYALDGQTTRLVYRSEVSTGGYVPGWVKEKLSTGPLKDLMTGFRGRAEK
jgi:hypothetical protein